MRVPVMRKTEQEHEITKVVKFQDTIGGPTFEDAVLD